MTKKTIVDTPNTGKYPKRMRIVMEISCDNTAAMFNRNDFNLAATLFAMLWNNPDTEKRKGEIFGGPVVYLATEECEP